MVSSAPHHTAGYATLTRSITLIPDPNWHPGYELDMAANERGALILTDLGISALLAMQPAELEAICALKH